MSQDRNYQEEIEMYTRDAFFYGLEKHIRVKKDTISNLDAEFKALSDSDKLHKEECYVVSNSENGDEMMLVINKSTGNLETYVAESDEFMEVLDGEDFWRNYYMINRR